MKKIVILMLCIILVVSLAACGTEMTSDESTGSDVATEESTVEDSAEVSEPDVDYDYKWPESNRDMLRHPEEFEGKTIYCYGTVDGSDVAEDGSDIKFILIHNDDEETECAFILYKGELNENPLENDHVSAIVTFDKVYADGSDSVGTYLMFTAEDAASVKVIPED